MTLNHPSILNLARSHSELVQNKLSKLLLSIFYIVAYYDHNYNPSHMLRLQMNASESDHNYRLKDYLSKHLL